MTQTINRRQAIAGTLAGLATVPLTPAPLAAMADNDPDIELIDLFREYYRSHEDYKAALNLFWNAEEAAESEYPEVDECLYQPDPFEKTDIFRKPGGRPVAMSRISIQDTLNEDGDTELANRRTIALNDLEAKRTAIDARY